jgi:hypothetical protein
MVLNTNVLLSQNADEDMSAKETFPLLIGNIGFATDSMEIVVGDVPLGEITTFTFDIYNFGENPITFTNGKSNNFVDVKFEPSVLMPATVGKMNIEFSADSEMNFGNFIAEVSIVSDDVVSPYKFMNLIMNIVEGSGNKANRAMLDTIPSILFDHYNYDFGHFVRGRRDYHTFEFQNIGGVPLVIDSIVVPKGIEVSERPTDLIYPEGEANIKIKINSHGRVGVQHQSILVYSNDPNNSLIILGVHGSVRVLPSHKKTSVQCNPEQRY